MSTRTLEAQPPEVGQLGAFEARMARNLNAAVQDWDEVCSALGAWEAGHLTGNEVGPAAEQHRAWVSKLISWGQLMERLTEHPEFSDPAVAARVKARLRHLQDKLALWHGEMTRDEEERIMHSAFA